MGRDEAIKREDHIHGGGGEIEPIDWIDLGVGGQILTYEIRRPRADAEDILVQRRFVVYRSEDDAEVGDGELSSTWERLGGNRGEP